MRCLNCGADVDNGLGLCRLCQHYVTTALPYLAVYFRNLSRWKPERAGSRPVPGSREPSGVTTARLDRVWDALDEAHNELVTRARELADDRPGHLARVIARILTFDEERTFRLLCALFERRIVTVATLGWAGDFVTAVNEHEARLRELTESVAPGWYAGACKRCGTGTSVVPGLTWVTCGGCGITTYARDHIDTVLDEARGWEARPMRIAEAVVALVDTEQSVARLYERIKKWEQRGKVDGIRAIDSEGDQIGPKRYRLGDVLDLIRAEGATRTARVDSGAA